MKILLLWVDKVFGLSFQLMSPLPALVVLAVFSVLTAVISLLVVRWTSNQEAIRRTKDLIAAHVLEVRLFSDQLSVVLRAYVSLLGNTILYLRYVLTPLLVLTVPMLVLFGQLEARFERMPLEPGRNFLVAANIQTADSLPSAVLQVPPELVQASPPVHVPLQREIDWELQGLRAGVYDIRLVVHGQEYSKRVVVGTGLAQIVAERSRGGLWHEIIDPGEPPLPPDGVVEQIKIQYPDRLLGIGSWKVGWLAPYAVLTVAAALLLKGVLGVEI